MGKTKKCYQCHQAFIPKRNPKQHYCSALVCQNNRKHKWRKQKRACDHDYRENQRRANQHWQKRNPEYWHQYRETCVDYAKRNREQTKLRKKKRQIVEIQGDVSRFAKSDALPLQKPVKPGVYRMIRVADSGFAKSDAFLVTIADVTRVSEGFSG